MTDTPAFRGTPPNQKQLAQHLGTGLTLWHSAVTMTKEFGAEWRWAHSEATGGWSYRAYLPGDRFFVSLSLRETGFEASFNMKAAEWELVHPEGEAERETIEAFKARAVASGEDPAWLHVPVATEADLKALSKLLVARGRRVQPPRGKKPRKHR